MASGPQEQDLAIVLRVVPFEERHRIVTALTEHQGLVTAMARNAAQSRRFGGTLEPFAASLWSFHRKPGAELAQLSEAQIRRGYEGLRKDFGRLALASAFNELMLRLAPPGEACSELFRLHSNALAALDEAPLPSKSPTPDDEAAPLRLLNAYLAKALQWSGHQPRVTSCLSCSKPLDECWTGEGGLSCVVSDAGWVCTDCRSAHTRHIEQGASSPAFGNVRLRVTARAMLDFQRSLTAPIRQAPALLEASASEHRALFQFLEALLIYHVPGFDRQPLKSLRFLGLGVN